jgi:hypothetical protein
LLVLIFLAVFATSPVAQSQSNGAEHIDRTLNDLQVVYFFESPRDIDWGAVMLLSQRYGCEVTLVTLAESSEGIQSRRKRHSRSGIGLTQVNLAPTAIAELPNALTANSSAPDIVLFSPGLTGALWISVKDYFLAGKAAPDNLRHNGLVGVRKVYQAQAEFTSGAVVQGAIVNQRELFRAYAELIAETERYFFSEDFGAEPRSAEDGLYTRYELARYDINGSFRESDFLSGLTKLRLSELIKSVGLDGSASSTTTTKNQLRLSQKFERDFNDARTADSPRKRVDRLVSGYRALTRLMDLVNSNPELKEDNVYSGYVRNLVATAQRSTLLTMGLEWSGDIVIKDTPEGPKVKFRPTVTVAGPLGVTLAKILFFPGAGDSAVVVDASPHVVRPHQQFIREYLVDYGGEALQSGALDSLRFAVEIQYGGISMTARSVAGVRGSRKLQVTFLPSFRFIPKVADVLVDKTVSPFYWKAVVDKPKYYSGTVAVALKTPPGVSAGAVRQTLSLTTGEETQTIQFPLVAGTGMVDGIARLTLHLKEGGQIVAADTALFRVASCVINPDRPIAFLPDTSGLLEDILRMTDANITPLTDRALETGDLGAYQVIIIGSGSHRLFSSLARVTERVERFVRQGGLLVVFGQPQDWPTSAGALPIRPFPIALEGVDIAVGERNHRLFSKPYTILTRRLTETVDSRALSSPAEITTGKKLIYDSRTSSNRSLLTVANMGEGRVIYCGFPILQRISRLEINAIHLLANILNY